MKKVIVISAINLRSGGTLSILNDCLQYLDKELSSTYKIVALVHKKTIIAKTDNIEFIEFPNSVKSYFYKLYYEYIYFKKLSKELRPYLWLSLHDMSPNVVSDIRAVYCHNPSPFYEINIKEFFLDYKFAFFSWLYKYLYKINITKNNFVIVQQEWLKKEFIKLYCVKNIVVASPNIEISIQNQKNIEKNEKTIFFYPSFPRVFKNFELICEAVSLIDLSYANKFEVILTIDGTENKYSKDILQRYSKQNNIKFIGLQTREKVFEIYLKSDCLIFPSKLETWGLPISEFKTYDKSILAIDLPYAKETVGNYNKVKFFSLNNPKELSIYMQKVIDNCLEYDINPSIQKSQLSSSSWKELFEILLMKQTV
jgi:glycosyltransferase involved in cell wall biosynthesis